ncbi:unnamed protein product [Nippostrongylus brasiliensis]|uniref:DIS3-like exonuclease 2 n=1 Tax=Nippostrongylus brasiliensis TaxID=27835 RepID=A0A158QYD8_NIPBR|nr:unnamed protein product [Nippostrongylus brasiliensis]
MAAIEVQALQTQEEPAKRPRLPSKPDVEKQATDRGVNSPRGRNNRNGQGRNKNRGNANNQGWRRSSHQESSTTVKPQSSNPPVVAATKEVKNQMTKPPPGQPTPQPPPQQQQWQKQPQQQQRTPVMKKNLNQQPKGSPGNAATFFKPHMSEEEIRKGLENDSLLKGAFRINPRNHEEAFINNPDGTDFTDIAVLGTKDRNRALHGDVVAIRIKPRASWVVNEEAYKGWRGTAGGISRAAAQGESANGISGGHSDTATVIPVEKNDEVSLLDNVEVDDVAPPTIDDECPEEAVECGVLIDDESTLDSGNNKVVDVTIGEVTEVLPTTDCDESRLKELEAEAERNGTAVMEKLERDNKERQQQKKKKTYRVLSDLPLEEWTLPDDCLQKTGEVVGILEEKNTRLAMGKLEVSFGTQRKWAKFSPTDSKMPRLMIEAAQLPNGFFDRPQDFSGFLFLARMVEWTENSVMARGKLEKQLGPVGDIEAETEGLLVTNGVDTREFSDEVTACLPAIPETGWKIDEEELAKRRDLRNEIIFTIDPKTARDLDDALSITRCDNVDGAGKPGWEVGVHIADVSHFVYEGTVLDEWAVERANSVYLVHQVIPMLPRLLCEELCSLNAGVDRLTFSVIFKVDDQANIYDEWFGRSVIRSRVKLTYEHAQDFIENPEKDFSDYEMPEISDGTTVHEIKEKVLQLHAIASMLRRKRREGGSLQLDQPKMKFALDDDMKAPIGVSIYEAKDSNRLVEEFMLLANMSVARKIERHYQKTALLRCHPPPKAKVLRDAHKMCSRIGFPIDGTSSQQLSSALAQFRCDVPLMRSINQVLSTILMKAMELARYFCTGSVKSQSQYHHYALNVPFYTHFTSPIRRYPDIIVHRLLAASLGYCEASSRTVEELEKIAQHCNDKKLIAKKCGEASAETFFGLLVQKIGPIQAKGVVVNVLDASFDVLLFKYGIVKRVYVKNLEICGPAVFEETLSRLTIPWSTDNGKFKQCIQICTVVDTVLFGLPEPTKFEAKIKPRSQKESPTLIELWRKMENASDEGNNLDIASLLLD